MARMGGKLVNIDILSLLMGKALGGGGGGGGRGQTRLEYEESKTATEWEKNDRLIGMLAGIKNGDEYIKTGEICLAINDDDSTLAVINADHINISGTSTAHLLSSSIVYDAQGRLVLKESTGGGIYTEHTSGSTTTTVGIWDKGNLTGGVMVEQINGQTGTVVKILASRLDITGDTIANWIQATDISVADLGCETFYASADATFDGDISAGDISCGGVYADTLSAGNEFALNGDDAEWKQKTVVTSVTPVKTTSKSWALSDGSSWIGQLMTSVSVGTATINYVGKDDTV